MGQDECRFHIWKSGTLHGESMRFETPVDHRQALYDALLSYDVPSDDVIKEFERLVMDDAYEAVD